MFYSYVIQSVKTSRLYKGHTSNLSIRLSQHNSGAGGKHTQKDGPWVLVFSEILATRADAMAREKFYKSGKGREFLKKALKEQSATGG